MRKRSALAFAIALGSILGFLLSANSAAAVYTWVDYTKPVGTLVSAYNKSAGLLRDNYIDIYYDTTGSYNQLNVFRLPICIDSNTGGGTIDIEVNSWSGTATSSSIGSIVASSSLTVDSLVQCSGNVTGGFEVVGTTTDFALNNYITGWGIPLRFRLYGRQVENTGARLQFSTSSIATGDGKIAWGTQPYNYYWTDNWGSNDWSPNFALIGNGIPPPPTINAETAYSSSTIAIYCEPTSWADFGCLFSNAIAWAFVIPDDAFDDFATLADVIKNKPPLGYFMSAANAIGNIATTSTTTLSIPAPIMSLVFTPLRAALVLIIAFAGLIWLYNRVKNINV